MSEETERRMWTANRPADPTGSRPYGYGFTVTDTPDGGKRVGHSGSQEKARTALLLDPRAKKGVAVMTGCEWADPMTLATALLDAIR